MVPATTDIPANPSAQLSAALSFIECVNKGDIDEAFTWIADDVSYHILPESIGMPPKTKEEFRAYLKEILQMITNFTVTIHDIMESRDRVLFYATSTATSTTGYAYANEYNFILNFTTQADGMPKISVMKEFMDSKKLIEFFTEEKNRQAAKHLERSLA